MEAAARKAGARVPRVVAVLAGLLERAAERGDGDGAAPSAFRGKALPAIPVRRYAERIYRYAGCSPACFVVAYVYLDRLAQLPRNNGEEDDDDDDDAAAAVAVGVDSYSVHRLLITAVMVAAKFMDDMHYNNAYFARVGGVEVAEMNALELELLFALRFRLNVAPDTFARYCAALEGQVLLADSTDAAAPPPPPPLVTASVSDDDDEERSRRHDNNHQAALLIGKNKDAAAAVRQVGVGSRAAAAAAGSVVVLVPAVVVPRAAVEMVAQ